MQMTYHVLARKWRPQTFSDLVGQNHVVKALSFALSNNHVHHAYLFTGTRGVGKTSIARIFAKSLNCENNGVSANPCGECESCREIKSGKFVDLIEVDAASRTGVDETRELIDSVAYLPTKGRYKVYLIDEVHMFSKSSFNALLKTLEEPPEHVKFILATTDPDKLPITILSRCLQFNLKSLTQGQIRQHLANICEAESIRYDDEALALLAGAGDGSMRDTLSMTDQAIAYGHGELHTAAVTEILGTIQPADIEAILFAIATNNPNQLSEALHRLDDYEVDARAFLIEVMQRLQRMAWAKEGIVEGLSSALLSAVADVPKPLLHIWYDIAEKALPNLAVSGEPRQSVEMALLRMLAFIPNDWMPRHRTVLEESLNAPKTDTPEITSVDSKGTDANPMSANQSAKSLEAEYQQRGGSDNAKNTPSVAASTSGFAEHVHATPVAQTDDLAAAEAQFSGALESNGVEAAECSDVEKPPINQQSQANDLSPQPVSYEKEIEEIKSPQMSQQQPLVQESLKATPTLDNVQELAVEQNQQTTQQPSEQPSSWHLAQEESSEPIPSMDDINAMMQRASDMPTSAPLDAHISVNSATNHPANNANNNIKSNIVNDNAEPTVQPQVLSLEPSVDNSLDDIPPWQSAEQQQPVESDVAPQVSKSAATPSIMSEPEVNQVLEPVIEPLLEPVPEMVIAEQQAQQSEYEKKLPPRSIANDTVNATNVDLANFQWLDAINQLSLSDYTRHFVSLGIVRLQSAENCVEAVLDLPPTNAVMETQESLDELQAELQKYLQQPVRASVNLTVLNEQTPAEVSQQRDAKQQSDLLTQFQQQPIVKQILENFEGQIIEKTIKPSN